MNYGKSLILPYNDRWGFESPGPTSLGQHGTHIELQCANGETVVVLASLIGAYVNPLNPGLGLEWHFFDLCHAFLSSTFQDDSTCGFRSPNLVETSNQASPYQISYDVVNAFGNSFATNYYSDLTIDGPTPSEVDPHECCTFCPIPKRDLTLTYRINPFCDTGTPSFSVPLVYSESPDRWEAETFSYQCVGRGLPSYDFTFTFTCENGLVLRISGPASVTCAFYVLSAMCDPFHLAYTPFSTTSFSDPPCPIASLIFTTVFIDE